MTLDEALAVLCRAHINDMDQPRWFVQIPSGAPSYLHDPMIQAWTVVRQHVLDASHGGGAPNRPPISV